LSGLLTGESMSIDTGILGSIIEKIVNHYQEDEMRLIGLVTWLVAWRAANLLSKNTKHAFQAHVLYTIANICMLTFYIYYEHIEMALMAFTFLITSIKGCFNYRPSKIDSSSASER
jgi:hypothetical protein